MYSRPIALQSWLFGRRGPRGNVYYLGMALEDLYGLAVERSRDVSLQDEKRLRDRFIKYGPSPSTVQKVFIHEFNSLHLFLTYQPLVKKSRFQLT